MGYRAYTKSGRRILSFKAGYGHEIDARSITRSARLVGEHEWYQHERIAVHAAGRNQDMEPDAVVTGVRRVRFGELNDKDLKGGPSDSLTVPDLHFALSNIYGHDIGDAEAVDMIDFKYS